MTERGPCSAMRLSICERDYASSLNPRDARRERLVISVNGKALFPDIQVLLNAVVILLGPFIGLAVSHKVIVGQVG